MARNPLERLVSLKRLQMGMDGGIADEDETLQILGQDKTSKEADKVSRETRLSSKEAGRKGWWRGRERRGEEEKEGTEVPSSRENQFRKTMGF
jgi:hypothetical protein